MPNIWYAFFMKTLTTIEQLRQFKKTYCLKQTTLATMMSVDKFTLNRWLTGKCEPSKIYDKCIIKFLAKNNH